MKFQPSSSSASELSSPAVPVERRLPVVIRRFLTMLAIVGIAFQFQGCPGPTPVAEPSPSPPPSPAAATPAPALVAPATPAPPVPKYNGTQQSEYITTAQNGFVELRAVKSDAFALAYTAFAQAGGAGAQGLTSKEAVAARRALIEKARQANEDYLAFVNTQDETYRQELTKTPLVQGDVDSIVDEFSKKSNADALKKVRENKRDILKTADDMMDYLEKKFGAWKVSGANAVFTKAADANGFAALGKKYNGFVQAEQKLQADLAPPLPPPGTSPVPSVSPSPGATIAPTAAMPAATAGGAAKP